MAPEHDHDPAGFTKRFAVGGAIVGVMVGLSAGVLSARRGFAVGSALQWGTIAVVVASAVGAAYGWLVGVVGVKSPPAPDARAYNALAIAGGGLGGAAVGTAAVAVGAALGADLGAGGVVLGSTAGGVLGVLAAYVPVLRRWGFDPPRGR